MTGIVPTRIVSFVLLTTCAALCQRPEHPSTANALPDAPSAGLLLVQTQTPCRSLDTARLPVAKSAAAASLGCGAQFEFARVAYSEPPTQKAPGDFFARYLSPSPTSLISNRNHAAVSESLLGRATDAASSVVVTHDDSGRSRPNTSYLLRVLASAIAHSAYRPYWRRSISQPFSDFGATIGNDAGMSVLHEFEPGILHVVKSHQPKFVSGIGERIRRSR